MTVFTPDSSKIEHERRLLDFEELLPQWLPYGRWPGAARHPRPCRSQQGKRRNFRCVARPSSLGWRLLL